MKLVAIDNGNWDIKVYDGRTQFKFRAKIEKANDNLNAGNSVNFCYNNEGYIVGDGASVDNMEPDKTINDVHRICAYSALSRLADKFGTDFSLIGSYPLNMYLSDSNSFERYLKTGGYIEVALNGESKLFNVPNVTVFPQCIGALFNNAEEYKDRTIGILDLGGLTSIGCCFDNLNLIRDMSFTENMGGITLQNKIKKALEKRFGMNINEWEMMGIIRDGLQFDLEGSKKIIDEECFKHAEEIRKILRKNNWGVDYRTIVLIGGTSVLLQKYLSQLLPYCSMSRDPIYENVKGLYKVGEMLYA